MTDDFVVPDLVDPIIGWRCWGIAETEDGYRLCSGTGEVIWPPRQQWVAACIRDEDHDPPEEGCTCGIYALSFGVPYYDYDGKGYAVFGQVQLWGRVVEGECGYRAQYAYPSRLFLAHKDWRFLSPLEVYDVPVDLHNPYEIEDET